MIERNFNLHLTAGHSIPLVINANQYDQGESWVFTLFNSDGTKYVPSTGAIVGIKSDNLGIINSGSVVDGKVVITETQQMTAAPGRAVFELMIDNQTHGTANFVLMVEPKPGNNADLSDSDLSLIQEALDAVNPLPTGGSVGQVLTKTANGSAWSDAGTPTQEQVADAVSDWADDNITVTTGVVIDQSLRVSGAAADAKAVGDELDEIKDLIESKSGELVNVIPVLYLVGDVSQMSKDVRSQLQYTFVDSMNHTQRTGWCDAKWQGDSSLSYPKKNYTFRFYHDPSFTRKDKINYFDLTKQSKWVTKANWIDHSHARNIVSARLWSAIVHSRVSAPPELLTASPNNGAINGEPVVIYLNGSYIGLYTMNIPKEDFTFGMDAENPLHCCAYGQYNNNGASTSDTHVLSNEFRYASEIGWECEVPGEWTTDTRAGLIQLINFVMSSTDAQFKENLDTYLDVESALDYYLFCYFIGASDSLAQNMILLTYDGGSKWYCSAYDLDSTFGLYWNGSSFYSSTMACPEDYQDTNNLLWERIEANFGNELYARYRKLRSSVLSLDYINREFEFFMGQIPQDEYDNDIIKWANIPQRSVNHLNQIKTWIASRAEYVDAQIADMASPVPCTGITLSESSLTFTDYGTHQLFATVQPEDCTQTVNWSSSDTSVATVNQNGLVTTIANGTATITVTCGNYSATCSVTMAYDEFGWSSLPQYDVNESTGEIISGSSYKSKSIPVTKGVWNFQNSAGNFNYLKAVVYDENDNFVFVFTPASNNNLSVDIFEDGYEVILIAYPKSSSANPSQSLTFTKSSEVWGSYNRYKINEETGIISQYSNSNNCVTVTDIPVDSGATYVFTANLTWKNVFQYDTNGNFIKCETTAGTSAAKTATMESNTAYVRLSGVGTVANAKAYTFVKQ